MPNFLVGDPLTLSFTVNQSGLPKDKTYEVSVNILIDTYPTKYHGEWIFEDKYKVNEAVFGVATAIGKNITNNWKIYFYSF